MCEASEWGGGGSGTGDGEAEVGYDGTAFNEHDVGGLEVPVNDTHLMGRYKGREDLADDGFGSGRSEWPVLL